MATPLVNSGTSGFISGSATTIATAATSLTAGNLIIAFIRLNGSGGQSVSGVTDTAGNTYVKALNVGSADGRLEIWYAENALGHASNVVTAAFSASAAGRSLITAQFANVVTSGALGVTGSGTAGSGTSVVSGSVTTTQADELVVCCAGVLATGSTWTPTNPLATVLTDNSAVMTVAHTWHQAIDTRTYQEVSSNSANAKAIAVATFKLATPFATAQRVSHVLAEVASRGTQENRVSHVQAELASRPEPENRVSHVYAELATRPVATQRVSHVVAEVARRPKYTQFRIVARYSGGGRYQASVGEGTLTVVR